VNGLWDRFVENGSLSRLLRMAAVEVERLETGAGGAAVAVMVWHRTKGGPLVGELTVKDTSGDLAATVTFLDAEGHETSPDQVPVWSSSDESVATVTAADDGLSATIAVGGPGVTLIEARETETVEETGETSEVVAQGTLTVQPGDAVIGSVEFAAP
jgi:hypothetical protein